jgi:hypothetical protein
VCRWSPVIEDPAATFFRIDKPFMKENNGTDVGNKERKSGSKWAGGR